jgi:PIN domain nuclease of toxin-antitoxin system
MEILLDTHVVIWWLEASPELSKFASSVISDKNNLIIVSAVVGWELAIKVNLGKFSTEMLTQGLGDRLKGEGFVELSINMEHAVRAGLLPLHHRDPFDRMLVAQAQAKSAPILSADRALDAYDVRRIW